MEKIEKANQIAVERMMAADPVLVDVVPANEAIPELDKNLVLHAGPPISWEKMCGPMQGAVMGIAVFENWAKNLEEAESLAKKSTFKFRHICNL